MLAPELVLRRVGVVDVVRRIGEASCRRAGRRARARRRPAGRVAAEQPMVAQDPEVARPADRLLGRRRDLVLGLVRPASPSAIASSRSSSVASKPIRSRSKPLVPEPASSAASSASSQPAFSASWLSASTYARFCASLRCASWITGTSSSPSFRAASTRPCPAMMPPCSSTSTGLVQPNSTIDAAIWATCASQWVRGLRSYGCRRSIGHSSIRSASATSPVALGCVGQVRTSWCELGCEPDAMPVAGVAARSLVFLRLSAGSSATGWCEPRVRRGATPVRTRRSPEPQAFCGFPVDRVRT